MDVLPFEIVGKNLIIILNYEESLRKDLYKLEFSRNECVNNLTVLMHTFRLYLSSLECTVYLLKEKV